ncbi:Uncharacterised protein [Vibrio cholerae]|nr:Uncharacterised protein [Vibrio cholerae]
MIRDLTLRPLTRVGEITHRNAEIIVLFDLAVQTHTVTTRDIGKYGDRVFLIGRFKLNHAVLQCGNFLGVEWRLAFSQHINITAITIQRIQSTRDKVLTIRRREQHTTRRLHFKQAIDIRGFYLFHLQSEFGKALLKLGFIQLCWCSVRLYVECHTQ